LKERQERKQKSKSMSKKRKRGIREASIFNPFRGRKREGSKGHLSLRMRLVKLRTTGKEKMTKREASPHKKSLESKGKSASA